VQNSNSNNNEVPIQISSTTELQDFKNVTNNLMQDALNVWADLWAELETKVGQNINIVTKSGDGLEPSCGWKEFLEKMWVLRHYLEFNERLSHPSSSHTQMLDKQNDQADQN
jgi:hypothetical protein